MNRLYRNKKGLTLVEVLVATLLMSIVFLAVTALYLASQRFYFRASDKVLVGYELQYAIEHIYKNVMTGIGDYSNPAVEIVASDSSFRVRHIDQTDPEGSPTYRDYTDDTWLTYTINADDGTLVFNNGTLEESLVPTVAMLLTDPDNGENLSRFYLEGGALKVKLTAEHPASRGDTGKERLTLYSACYPRLASF